MYTIVALYHFTHFINPEALMAPVINVAHDYDVTGTILLAHEGINGTVAGDRNGIEAMLSHIRSLPGCADLEWKESKSPTPPFGKMKVRLKREIVTMGQPNVDPVAHTGHYVAASDWNNLINRDDVAVIDTRNDYEVAIGTFDGAIDPKTASFRDFPAWWEVNKDRFHNKKIAMFCTGGIRCEKSTNYLIQQGVHDVYHLKGGILKYLEEVPKTISSWKGSCFVFDGRVSVDHGLAVGPHYLCHACRCPILPEDQDLPEYEAGVSCHLCIADTSEGDKQRFRERQKQVKLAQERGTNHLTGRMVPDKE
ncbi:rhodanese-related sulfurtransferase [Tateyamaria sp.]|nr:rhodanese-related sulfurtransferase [Tateyamaria sp.]